MVKVTNIIYDNKEKGMSHLEFDIEGTEINYVIISTIRRTILTDIPIYAWTDFTFKNNSSVFHNNFLKNQIKNIPVWGIENDLEVYEAEKHQVVEEDLNEDLEDNVDLSVDKNVDSTSLNQITMYVDHENRTNDIESITTEMAKFYFSQKQIENPYPIPIQLVKLQPTQKINFTAISSVGTEKTSGIYSAVSICVYEQKADDKFRFNIESRGQITEKRIFHLCFLNLNKKLKTILGQIEDNPHEEGEIQINHEDHTIGNLLSSGLQNHKNVQFAGYHMPHPLEKRVIISYKLKSGKFKEILKEVIENFIDTFEKIDKEIETSKF